MKATDFEQSLNYKEEAPLLQTNPIVILSYYTQQA